MVAWDADHNGDEVDLGMAEHIFKIVKRQFGAEGLLGCACCVLVRGAHGGELVVWQRLQSWHVRVGAPAAPDGRNGGAHNSDPNPGSHGPNGIPPSGIPWSP